MVGYERGSEWRRWDLHIHTPGTQKNDRFEGANDEEKWDRFYETIEKYIGDGTDPRRNIAVIGITDYLSVDNCKRVMRENRLPESVKMVLPNVELRMGPIAKESPINIHCIFDPENIDELESRFFSKLIHSFSGCDFSASHDDLRRFGRLLREDDHLEDAEAYRAGIEHFVINQEDLEAVFKGDSELRDKTIIVVSNKSSDGVSGISQHAAYHTETGSQMDATRQSIYKMADLIFSSNSNDRKYFLGESKEPAESIIRRYGSLKGCVHGSDAHTNEKIFKPDGRRYCWIKGDPTFNGFRQILYEPKNRIYISEIKPEEKPAYRVIDSVIFNNPEFAPEPILFSDKLTCIIGGKSTGKSLLLQNMARAIDPAQVTSRLGKTHLSSLEVPEIQVKWVDGTIVGAENTDENHKIVYIPQTFLNRLLEQQEEQTEIDEIISNIVMLNATVAEAHEKMAVTINDYKPKLDRTIYDCVQQYNDLERKKRALAEIGTRSGIENEIAQLKEKKREIFNDYSLVSEEMIDRHNVAVAEVTKLKAEIATIQREIETIENMADVIRITSIPLDLTDDVLKIVNAAIERIRAQANEVWRKEQASIVTMLCKKRDAIITEMAKHQEFSERIASEIAGNEAMKQISERIRIEEP